MASPMRCLRLTAAVIAATLALTGCGTIDAGTTLAPAPTVPPTTVTSPGPTLPAPHIEGDPRDFVLRRGDLPAGFAEPLGEYQEENLYSVAYLRLQGLSPDDPARTPLLGVLSSVGIYESPELAVEEFDAGGGDEIESVQQEITESAAGVTDISVTPMTVSLDGVDRALGFRINYSAGGVGVVGHRYRFVVGNAVATLSVIARAPAYPEEPPELPAVAADIAARQIAHLRGS